MAGRRGDLREKRHLGGAGTDWPQYLDSAGLPHWPQCGDW